MAVRWSESRQAESPAEQPPDWARSSQTRCRAALPPGNPDQPIRTGERSTAQNEASGPNWVTELKDGFVEKQFFFFFFKGHLLQTTKLRAESDQVIPYLTPYLFSPFNQPFNIWQPKIQTSTSLIPDTPICDIIAPALTTSQGFTFTAVVFLPDLKRKTEQKHPPTRQETPNPTQTCDRLWTIRMECDPQCSADGRDDMSRYQNAKHIIYLHPCTWHPKFKTLYLSLRLLTTCCGCPSRPCVWYLVLSIISKCQGGGRGVCTIFVTCYPRCLISVLSKKKKKKKKRKKYMCYILLIL